MNKKMNHTAKRIDHTAKHRKLLILMMCVLAAAFALAGCGAGDGEQDAPDTETTQAVLEDTAKAGEDGAEAAEDAEAPTLLYMGHASIRVVTGDDKVIYIDPYAGEGYDLPADLILVTHDHYDHNNVDLITERSDDCRVITQKEALEEGDFDLGYVTVEAVEAGNNPNHSISECVGYVLTFADGKSVYVSGDTSTTDQMAELAKKHIDYAFFCCDGVYNMDLEEAAECAALVQAKHNIPYHIVEAEDPDHFDAERAEQFAAPDKMVLQPGDEITL